MPIQNLPVNTRCDSCLLLGVGRKWPGPRHRRLVRAVFCTRHDVLTRKPIDELGTRPIIDGDTKQNAHGRGREKSADLCGVLRKASEDLQVFAGQPSLPWVTPFVLQPRLGVLHVKHGLLPRE